LLSVVSVNAQGGWRLTSDDEIQDFDD